MLLSRWRRKMSPQDDFVHSVNNQLEIVLGKAELLELTAKDQPTRDSCAQIKAAACKVAVLMNAYMKKQRTEAEIADINELRKKHG